MTERDRADPLSARPRPPGATEPASGERGPPRFGGVQRVEDAGDPRISGYRNLKETDFRRAGVFVAEGVEVVRTLIERSPFAVASVLLAERKVEGLASALARLPAAVPVYAASQDVLAAIAGFDVHRGCLALGVRPPPARASTLLDQIAARSPGGRSVVLVLEAVSNHDNVGGIFRNARGFGADLVLLDPRCADPLYRKAIRVSMGAALTVPFATLEPWPDGLAELEGRGYAIAALTPKGTVDLARAVAEGALPQKVALLFGTEGSGLTDAALARAGRQWRIPMAEGADSLNVAVAAAISLFALQVGGTPRP